MKFLSLLILSLTLGCQVKNQEGGNEIVSNHTPSSNRFSLSTALNKTYSTGQNLDFTLTFPAAVTVTGTPRITFTIGASTKHATYVSGSGSQNLVFRYVVAGGDTDSDGIALNGTTIDLQGGSLKFNASEDCNLSFSASSISSVLVDTTAPSLTSVTAPANATYGLGQSLNFTATFSEAVVVTGTPSITLDVGGSAKAATYVSGSGSPALVFRFTVGSSDADANGISVSSPVALNSGTIRDVGGNSSALTFTPPNTAAVLVAGANPVVTSVVAPTNATYLLGNNLNFTLVFNKAVTVTGAPRLSLNIGGATRYATYLSGSGSSSIVFRYTVVGGDLDSDGIALASPAQLNGGTLRDTLANDAVLTFSPPSLSGVKVYTTAPGIVSINLPGSIPPNGYLLGETVDLTVVFSENITATGTTSRLKLDVGGATRYATYQSGSGTSSFVYRYTVGATDQDLNGLAVLSPLELNGSTLASATAVAPVVTFTPPTTTSLKIDAVAPTIVSNTVPASASYIAGQNLDYDVTFSEPVNVTGTPRLVLDVGGTTRYATYLSGHGTSVLRFRYPVVLADNDADGIATNASIDLNSGTIRDPALNSSALVLSTNSTGGVLVDNTAPAIISVTPPANGTYSDPQNLDFDVLFSEAVTVTGSPRIALTIGSTTRYATYLSGSTTATLKFRYTVASGDFDGNGIVLTSPIALNGGTIRDGVTNNSSLGFTLPNTSLVLVGTPLSISSVTPPANAEYTTGQNIDFTVVFTDPVVVTLIPRIQLTLTSGTAYATYLSGGGTDTLTFRYTVGAGAMDLDGIVLASPLDLNGGAIQDVSFTQNAVLSYTLPTTSGILVDGVDATLSSVTAPANGTYNTGDDLDFVATYSSAVTVTGTPRIGLTIGAAPVQATYVSGSGTTALTFRYTVGSGDEDTTGIASASPIDLNSGTIKDATGDDAPLAFTPPNTALVLVDAISPSISSVSAPANGTYYNGDNVDFTVVTSEAVTVTGAPRISLTVGSSTVYATYFSGSGSSSLSFRYTVSPGDLDANGISVVSPISLNGGTLADAAGNNASPLTFTAPDTSSINVDGTNASITALSAPANATHKTGNHLDFVATFSRAVTVTGAPRIALTIGSSTVYASYLSGSGSTALTFRYTVASGDSDADGIAVTSPLELNSGTIKDSTNNNAILTFTAPNTSAVLVDGIDLAISSVTAPADGTYAVGGNLNFTVLYNDRAVVTGSPRIQLTVGSSTLYATYVSGSGTTSLVFRYTVSSGDLDADGITTVGPNLDLNGGTIKDDFGDNALLAFTGTTYPGKLVEGTVPTISSVAGPAAATYYEAGNLDFVATFSEAVTVTGTPRIALTIGAATRHATYLSGSGSSSLTFRYTVVTGDSDNNGIASASPLELNGGTIADAAGNNASPLTFTPPNTSAVNVNATTAVISSVTPDASATYKTSTDVTLVVNFSKPVVVVGTPRIALTVGATTAYATYTSGSTTSALTFKYTVASGASDSDGIVLISPVELNGGTIRDISMVNAALAFTLPDTSGILVDGIDVSISSITPPADKTYKNGEDMNFTVAYNHPAYVTGAPRIQLTVGAATLYATYFSGSGTASHVFRYTVGSSDADADGIATVGPAVLLNGGTIRDAYNDAATVTFTGSSYPNKKVDGVAPTISSMAVTANKTYIVGEHVEFTATYSEAVTISGTPRLALTVGATTRYATYLSGTGTASIKFRYTVPSGDSDTNGIAVATSVDLNSGSIVDAATNAQSPLTFSAPVLTGVLVDGIAPSISSLTAPTATTYGAAANLNFTVTFSEAVTVTGTPTLSLNVGGASRTASYVSGSGSTGIVFRYTTVSGDSDTDGVASSSPLLLAGGTVRDAAGNSATLTFTGSTHAGVLVDAVAPAVASVTVPTDGAYKAPTVLSFTVDFNENVTVTGTPRLQLSIGANTRMATYASGSGSASLVFSYTLVAADLDLDGIAIANSSTIDLNGGTIRDGLLNNASLPVGSTNLSRVYVVFSNMRSWYDFSDAATLTLASTNVTGVADKIGAFNLAHTGAAYSSTGFNGGSRGYATCTAATEFAGTSTTTPMALVAVFRAPTTTTNQYLLYHNNTSRPMLSFSSTASSGTVTFGVNGSKYSASTWSTAAATATSTWTSGAVMARAFSWSSTQNRAPLFCKMNGEISEFFVFTAQPSTAEMTAINSYLSTKHSLTFP